MIYLDPCLRARTNRFPAGPGGPAFVAPPALRPGQAVLEKARRTRSPVPTRRSSSLPSCPFRPLAAHAPPLWDRPGRGRFAGRCPLARLTRGRCRPAVELQVSLQPLQSFEQDGAGPAWARCCYAHAALGCARTRPIGSLGWLEMLVRQHHGERTRGNNGAWGTGNTHS